MVLAGELRELLDHHRARGHVDAERQRLGREHDLQQAGREGLFDCLLHRRDHPRVVRRDPRLEAGEPLVVPEHLQVGVVERLEVGVGDTTQLAAGGRVGEPDAAGEALLDGPVAARPREHEHDRREHPLVGQPLDHLRPPRLVAARPPSPRCERGRARRAWPPPGWVAARRRRRTSGAGAAARRRAPRPCTGAGARPGAVPRSPPRSRPARSASRPRPLRRSTRLPRAPRSRSPAEGG